MTPFRTRAARALSACVLLALLPGCVYYNTLYLAKRYYQRSFDDVPYALDKSDLSTTPQFTRTIDLSKKVIQQYPKSKYLDDAYLLWAKSLIGSDDPRQAVRMLEDFDALHPKSTIGGEAKFYLGVAYLRARKYEQALQTFDAYLAKNPKHHMAPYAYFERSRALLALDRPEEAAQSVGQVLERFPKSRLALRARIAHAEALIAQKSFDAARGDYRILGRHALTDDDRLEYLLDEADCLMGASKNDEAMGLLKDAIAHEHEPARTDTTGGRFVSAPTGPGADHYGRLLLRIGTVHLRSNRLDDALAAYRRVIDDYPHSGLAAEAQYRVGYGYETVGDDFERAKSEYARVRDQGPNTAFSDQAAARVSNLDRLSKYRSAAGDTVGRAAEGAFLLAEQYLFQLDKPDRALEEYRKIEQSYAGTAWAAKALNAQGWVLAHKLKQPAAADSLFWKVVRDHPGTEAQLAARDYLEEEGVSVPSELIKLPERVYTHADSATADSVAAAAEAAEAAAAAAAAAAADTLRPLSPIPQGTFPLGTHAPAPGTGDSLRLGPRPAPFALPPVFPPQGSGAGEGNASGPGRIPGATDSTRTGAPAPGPGRPDSTLVPAPRDTTHPPAPGDTSHAIAPPGSPRGLAPPNTTHAAPPRGATVAPSGTTPAQSPRGATVSPSGATPAPIPRGISAFPHAADDSLRPAPRPESRLQATVGGTGAQAAKREASATMDSLTRATMRLRDSLGTGRAAADSARAPMRGGRDSLHVASPDTTLRIARPDTTRHAVPPGKTRRPARRAKSTGKVHRVAPADSTHHLAPADSTHRVAPADSTHHLAPADSTHRPAPADSTHRPSGGKD